MVLADYLESFQAVAKAEGSRAEPRGLLSGRDGAPVQGAQSGESRQERVCTPEVGRGRLSIHRRADKQMLVRTEPHEG